MTARLATVAPDLVGALERQTDQRQRKVATAVSSWIVDRVGLVDPRVDAALAGLRDQRFDSTPERDALQKLAEELDERAWDIQDRVEEGLAPQERYFAAFALARAANAVWFALDRDAGEAVLEAVYEAQAATGDLAGTRASGRVRSLLSLPPRARAQVERRVLPVRLFVAEQDMSFGHRTCRWRVRFGVLATDPAGSLGRPVGG